MKYDDGKAPIALVPPEVIEAMATVLEFGATKYGANNWRKDPSEWSRSYSSLQRHLNSFWSGEDFDPESGEPHLAHALTQCAFLYVYFLEQKKWDDRYVAADNE